MNDQLKKWNVLFTTGIEGMTEKECQDVLCFFHGSVKSRLAIGLTSPASFVQAMEKAVEYVKAKRTVEVE